MWERLTLSRLDEACAATLGFELEELPTLRRAIRSVLHYATAVERPSLTRS